MKAIIYLAVFCLAIPALAGKSPGRIGAYMNFGRGFSDTPEGIKALVDEAADAGIQFIMPMATTTSGMAMYDSKILPHAGDFDRLKVLIQAAHARGLKVHPWVQINSQGPRMLEEHPDWCQMNSEGKRVGYLDPSSPQVRVHVNSVVREIAENYEVDGINLDYVRYSGGGRYCFCDRCRSAFKEATGLDCVAADRAEKGTDLWRKWRAWRFGQINTEVEEIAHSIRDARPGTQVSAYVWGAQTYGANFQICQDFKTWIKRGWLDWINPSGYAYKPGEFRKRATDNRKATPPDFPMLITIGVTTSHGRLNSSDEVKTQVREAFDIGADGIVFFTLEYARPFLKDLKPLLHEIGGNRACN